jgi:hypothetical protein
VQRIEDPRHARGYRELRSKAEMRKLLVVSQFEELRSPYAQSVMAGLGQMWVQHPRKEAEITRLE